MPIANVCAGHVFGGRRDGEGQELAQLRGATVLGCLPLAHIRCLAQGFTRARSRSYPESRKCLVSFANMSLAEGTATAKFQPNNLIGSKACASLNGTKSCTMSSGVYAKASLGLVRPVLKEDDPVR
jgi:hypothetical protein